ncbi:ribonuclease TUDOR 1-like protein [Tanacetum coccineum]
MSHFHEAAENIYGTYVLERAEYIIPGDILEFCSIYLGAKNVGNEVNDAKGKVTPPELLYLEEEARQQGVGLWNMSLASAIRKLLSSFVGDPRRTMGLLASNKDEPIKAIIEQFCDGSLELYTVQRSVQRCVQAPSMGRIPQEISTSTEVPIDEPNPDAFGWEAKHFTELCVLHRDVNIVLEGLDNYSNFIGSVCYADGESAKDLAIELTENGYVKHVEWSAGLIEDETRRRLKAAELQANNTKLRLWMNYRPQLLSLRH